VLREENFEVCFSAHKPGNYYGLLFVRAVEERAAIGIRVNLDVEGNYFFSQSFLTGAAVREGYEKLQGIEGAGLIIISQVFLFLLLFLLIFVGLIKKRKKKESWDDF